MADLTELKNSNLQIPGIELLDEIGRGANSIVYRGKHDGQICAVKVMRADRAMDHGDVRFRREAGALARMNHPGLARVLTVGESSGRSYLVMEFVDGSTLGHVLQQGALSEARVVALASTLSGILAEVHRLGIVHQDIKPENILIDKSGAAKLIDFGLATEVRQNQEASDSVVGTFLYSAPEQTGMIKRAVDGRADLYAVGAVLYECLTGQPPFVARDVGELIRMHAVVQARDVCEVQPAVSRALGLIIAKLLAKDPDDRYQSAEGLLADLQDLGTLNNVAARGAAPLLGTKDTADANFETALIGRDRELETITRQWKQATQGSGGVLIVEGEPGSGKSRLIREVVARAQSASAPVLSAKCSLNNPMAFAPVREAVERYARTLQKMSGPAHDEAIAKLRRATKETAHILRRFSTAIAPYLEQTKEAAEVAQDQLIEALSDFFVDLSREHRGMLLFIDDVQWLDQSSRQVFRRVATRIGDAPLLFATAARNDEASLEGMSLFATDMSAAPTERFALQPLAEADLGKLVSILLGNHPADPRFVKQIVTRCNGSPFAAGEYLRAMLEGGALHFSWGSWVVENSALERLQLPTNVVQLVVRRLDQLDQGTRDVLTVAAALGSHFRPEILVRICGLDAPAIRAALGEATRARLVERGDTDDYVFVHDRIQEALLAPLTPEAGRALHQRIANDLQKNPEKSAEYVYALARHAALGEVDRNAALVVSANLAAGKQALSDLANEEAYLYLRKSTEIVTRAKLALTTDLVETLGHACHLTKRTDEAVAAFEQAISLSNDPIHRAQLRTVIIKTLLGSNRLTRAEEEITKAFGELKHAVPRGKLHQLLWTFTRHTWVLIGMKLGLFGQAKGKSRELTRTLADLYFVTGYLAVMYSNTAVIVQTFFSVFFYGNRLGDGSQKSMGWTNYAFSLATLQVPLYDGLARQALKMCEDQNDRINYAACMFYYAIMRDMNSFHKEAADKFRNIINTMIQWVDGGDQTNVFGGLTMNLNVRGHFREGRSTMEALEQRLSAASGTPPQQLQYLYLAANAHSCAALGDANKAQEYKRRALKFCEEVCNAPYPWGLYGGFAAGLALELGQSGDEADALVEHWNKHVGGLPALAFIYVRPYYCYIALLRLRSYEAEPTPERKKRLKKALFDLRLAANVPVLKQYVHLTVAGIHFVEGRAKQAEEALRKAEALAMETDSPIVLHECAVRRARWLAKSGNKEGSVHQARVALGLAQTNGWVLRERNVIDEFKLDQRAPTGSGSMVGSMSLSRSMSSSSSTATSTASYKLKRHLDALLQVSAASAATFDPDQQARVALDKIVQLLGAERAFLFLATDKTGAELEMKAGRDAEGKDLTELRGYSTTVVEKVRATRDALVVSGTDEGQMLGSDSAVAHNLRSIMAAPLMLHDELIGVVYLDNRLARGLFRDDDVEILTAIANHIAIAIETARSAQVEMERKALERDLALAGAVQTLLLPRESKYTSKAQALAAFFRPASQSGGDWWWYEVQPDGSTLIIVADVTGHGAGSAMVTAAVASAYRTARQMFKDLTVDQLLKLINASLLDLANGKYRMTLSAIVYHPTSGDVDWWNAGGPPLLILRKGGVVESANLPGTPLGSDKMAVESKRYHLEVGDRLLVFTDGLPEMTLPTKRQLGYRKVQRMLADTASKGTEESREFFTNALETARAGTALDDDITWVMLDRTAS